MVLLELVVVGIVACISELDLRLEIGKLLEVEPCVLELFIELAVRSVDGDVVDGKVVRVPVGVGMQIPKYASS